MPAEVSEGSIGHSGAKPDCPKPPGLPLLREFASWHVAAAAPHRVSWAHPGRFATAALDRALRETPRSTARRAQAPRRTLERGGDLPKGVLGPTTLAPP